MMILGPIKAGTYSQLAFIRSTIDGTGVLDEDLLKAVSPVCLRGLERILEGLRRAGMPEQ